MRIGTDAFTVADGIRSAALNGASVISLSLSFGCGDWHSSSRDGFLGSGTQLDKLLTAGHHVLTVEAVDAKGASSTATRAVDVISGSGLPSPLITAPTDHIFSPGQAVTLRGRATDPEDGPLTGASLRWSSNIDGFLGTGEVLTVTLSGPAIPCNPEFVRHTVTLLARDSDGHQVPAETRISVGDVC